MDPANKTKTDAIVDVVNPTGTAEIVLVCEHASAFIPEKFAQLGLSKEAQISHAAWDPGALGVAIHLSRQLDATLVAARVSRLVYDLNRPTTSPGAIPVKSEIYEIPGNAELSPEDRAKRIETFFMPFQRILSETLAHRANPILVTIHSFTPIYHGQTRPVEIGILHDSDTRLADAMLATFACHTERLVRRNEPYSARDGVTHTLQEHGIAQGRPNVMIEIRNDLIKTEDTQHAMATELAAWLTQAAGTFIKDTTCEA